MMDDREIASHEQRLLEALRARYPACGVARVQLDWPTARVFATSIGKLIGKGGVELERWQQELVVDLIGDDARVELVEVTARYPLEQAALEYLRDRYPEAEIEAVRLDDSRGAPPTLLVTAPRGDVLAEEVEVWKPDLVDELGLDFLVWIGAGR